MFLTFSSSQYIYHVFVYCWTRKGPAYMRFFQFLYFCRSVCLYVGLSVCLSLCIYVRRYVGMSVHFILQTLYTSDFSLNSFYILITQNGSNGFFVCVPLWHISNSFAFFCVVFLVILLHTFAYFAYFFIIFGVISHSIKKNYPAAYFCILLHTDYTNQVSAVLINNKITGDIKQHNYKWSL